MSAKIQFLISQYLQRIGRIIGRWRDVTAQSYNLVVIVFGFKLITQVFPAADPYDIF